MIPRIRAVALSTYVEVARLVGLDPFEMLNEHRIGAKVLAQPETWLGAPPAMSLLEQSASRSGRQDFAILMAERRSFGSLGPLSLLLRHLANAEEVVIEMNRFRRLIAEVIMIGVQREGDIATIRCHATSEHAGFQTTSFIVAMCHCFITAAVGGVWRPECVHFAHERPPDIQSFERFFQADLQFSSSFNGFSCSRQSLLAANPYADPILAGHARRLLHLLPVRSPADSVADRTRYAIAVLLSAGQARVEGVSAILGMSERTLQRSLDREGVSFAALLNETRRQQAVQLLNTTSLPIIEIAVELGYSCGSAFTRWFVHEYGETPAAWRNQRGKNASVRAEAKAPAA